MNKAYVELSEIRFEPWNQRGNKRLGQGVFQFHIVVNQTAARSEEAERYFASASFTDALGRSWNLLDSVDGNHIAINSSGESVISFGLSKLVNEPQDLVEHSVLKIQLASYSSTDIFSFEIYHNGIMGDLTWNLTATDSEAPNAR